MDIEIKADGWKAVLIVSSFAAFFILIGVWIGG